ncbi:hypothetical protein DVS28_b0168 (plasmid) [Euzebya pacifica]|uniref:Uncharacterized protein n=1 Tax=Euzebya pacifica TaxID=1608957 RepID=A0A346Y641_9ACTN|nr:hypothetical protein [Euzebya pacifica]AXV09938.1 hypothetical protein DVS28_b0168 [Euzebya pacifica]
MPNNPADADDRLAVPDHAIHRMDFESVAQRRTDGGVDCFVYLSGEVVWASTGHAAEEFPAGLDDAAGWAGKAYAKRLADLVDRAGRGR